METEIVKHITIIYLLENIIFLLCLCFSSISIFPSFQFNLQNIKLHKLKTIIVTQFEKFISLKMKSCIIISP